MRRVFIAFVLRGLNHACRYGRPGPDLYPLRLRDQVDDAALTTIADTLLANPVIEDFTIERAP